MGIQIQSLRLENVTFGYNGLPPVFENLDFEIPKSPLVWVHGEPGMGKSSLLKIMAGLLMPQSGRYLINGENVLEMSFTEFLPYRILIGYAFDTGGLLTNRTLYENLMLPLMFHQRCSERDANERVRFWMERFHLTKVRDQRPFSVTGSQRKSTVILRAFIHHPQLVLLDDAMSGLKEDGQDAFVELVEEAVRRNGLQHILFCSERELPIKSLSVKKLEMSYQRRPSAEVAS
jgi:phospholipid/cholesterol/gamma-HCH transport system ATP-binding protein